MRLVKTVRVSDRRDLLSASHPLSTRHQDSVEMSVERIDVACADAVAISMTHNHDVPPALMTIARENHHAVTNDINRIAQVGITAAESVPIFAEVSMRSKSASFVISLRVRFTNWQVESVRQSH